jgi:hypothetical protein
VGGRAARAQRLRSLALPPDLVDHTQVIATAAATSFSCKSRGVCPSCIFIEAVFRRYRVRGIARGDARSGAVTFVQRFGSSLSLNVHFHLVVLDGLYTREPHGRLGFHHAACARASRARGRGRTRAQAQSPDWRATATSEPRPHSEPASAIEACAALAVRRGSMRALRAGPDGDGRGEVEPQQQPPSTDQAVDLDGFNLHASVAIQLTTTCGLDPHSRSIDCAPCLVETSLTAPKSFEGPRCVGAGAKWPATGRPSTPDRNRSRPAPCTAPSACRSPRRPYPRPYRANTGALHARKENGARLAEVQFARAARGRTAQAHR